MAKGLARSDTRKKYYFSKESLISKRLFYRNLNIGNGNNSKRKLPSMEDIKILLFVYSFRRKKIFLFF